MIGMNVAPGGKEEGMSTERRKCPLFSPELRTGEGLSGKTTFLIYEFEQKSFWAFLSPLKLFKPPLCPRRSDLGVAQPSGGACTGPLPVSWDFLLINPGLKNLSRFTLYLQPRSSISFVRNKPPVCLPQLIFQLVPDLDWEERGLFTGASTSFLTCAMTLHPNVLFSSPVLCLSVSNNALED